MTLTLLIIAFAYTVALGLLRLNALVDPTRYRHPAHRAHPARRDVPADWTPLPAWVRAQLAPTVHGQLAIQGYWDRPAIEAGA